MFLDGRANEVIRRSEEAMLNYPEHELFPKFDYLKTVARGKIMANADYIASLKEYKIRYPDSELNENIDLVIAYFDTKAPEVVQEQQAKEAEVTFTRDMSAPHHFMLSLKEGADMKQLNFNIVEFNLFNYDNIKLDVKEYPLDRQTRIIIVSGFPTIEETRSYLERIMVYPDLWKDVEVEGQQFSLISEENLTILRDQKLLARYLIFYRTQY